MANMVLLFSIFLFLGQLDLGSLQSTDEKCSGDYSAPGRPPKGTKCTSQCYPHSGRWFDSFCYTEVGKWGAPCQKCSDEMCSGDFSARGRPPTGTKCIGECRRESGYWGDSWCPTEVGDWGAPCQKCSVSDCECGVKNTDGNTGGQDYVYYGDPVNENEYPWQVGIIDVDYDPRDILCGGSLISSNTVLTAAHCVAGRLEVVVGEHYQQFTGRGIGKRVRVKKTLVSPGYNDQTKDNDFALLFLEEEVHFSEKVSTICLPEDDSQDYAGVEASAAGWGTSENCDNPEPPRLTQASLVVLSNEVCVKENPYLLRNLRLSPNMMCAFGESQDTGSGDSGGPLVTKLDGEDYYTQIGVVSFGHSYCSEDGRWLGGVGEEAGVYARVTAQLQWIKSNMERFGGKTCPPPK